MLKNLGSFASADRRFGSTIVAFGALCAGAVVAGVIAWTGFVSVVVATGGLIERGLGLEPAAAQVSEGAFEALGTPIELAPWQVADGQKDGPQNGGARRPIVQTVSTASDTGKRFYSGDDDTYRTVCVRLCDGYYWTMSFSTTDEHFGRDQSRCESSCGVPARLFKYRNPGERPEDMEDLDGQPYGKLKTAFLFRTRYDGACRCQANPWEKEARAQHRLYEIAAIKTKLTTPQKAEADALRQLVAGAGSERRAKGAIEVAGWSGAPSKKASRSASVSRPRRTRTSTDDEAPKSQGKEAAAEASADRDGEGSARPLIAASARGATKAGVMRLGGPVQRPEPRLVRGVARNADWRQKVFTSSQGN